MKSAIGQKIIENLRDNGIFIAVHGIGVCCYHLGIFSWEKADEIMAFLGAASDAARQEHRQVPFDFVVVAEKARSVPRDQAGNEKRVANCGRCGPFREPHRLFVFALSRHATATAGGLPSPPMAIMLNEDQGSCCSRRPSPGVERPTPLRDDL